MTTKDDFLENAFLYNAMTAALQRNRLYSSKDTPAVRRSVKRAFRRNLAEHVETFLARSPVTAAVLPAYSAEPWSSAEAAFLSAVDLMRTTMDSELASAGSGGTFRVSHAQKGLSVVLKYYWCDGKTKLDPPFCPIDRAVLRAAGIEETWTRLDDMPTYVKWLSKLKVTAAAAGYSSVAAWELDVSS